MNNLILACSDPLLIEYYNKLLECDATSYYLNVIYPAERKFQLLAANESFKPKNFQDYLKVYGILGVAKNRSKDFDMNLELYAHLNNLEALSPDQVLRHLHDVGIHEGLIYSFKQLENAGVDAYLEDVLMMYKKTFLELISDIMIHSECGDNSCCNGTYVYLFLGIASEVDFLLGNILASKLHTSYYYVFIVKEGIEIPIRWLRCFPNYIVFVSKEYGNDIIPTLQAHFVLLETGHKVEWVYKFHTKRKRDFTSNNIEYLCNKKTFDELKQIITYKRLNCVAYPEYMCNFVLDSGYCLRYKTQYADLIDNKKQHAAGTVFFSKASIFTKTLDFIKSTKFRAYFYNNQYVCNSSMRDSPVHFLERFLGLCS